jgi:hypothetical protein
VNAAHTERTEEQEILFKSSADATATEIRRVKTKTKRGDRQTDRLASILVSLSLSLDHKVILKGCDAFSIYVLQC